MGRCREGISIRLAGQDALYGALLWTQTRNFIRRQISGFALAQGSQFKRADSHALQPQHAAACCVEQAPDLSISPFCEADLQPCVSRTGAQHLHPLGRQELSVSLHAMTQRIEKGWIGMTIDLNVVRFSHTGLGSEYRIRPIAVRKRAARRGGRISLSDKPLLDTVDETA